MSRVATTSIALLILPALTAPTATAESPFAVVDDVVKIALDTGEELPPLPPDLPPLFDAALLDHLGDPRPIRCIWNATFDYVGGMPYHQDPEKIVQATTGYVAAVTGCIDNDGFVVPCFDDTTIGVAWLTPRWDTTKIDQGKFMVAVPGGTIRSGSFVAQQIRLEFDAGGEAFC